MQEEFYPIQKALSYNKSKDGVVFDCISNGVVGAAAEIKVVSQNIFRIQLAPKGTEIESKPFKVTVGEEKLNGEFEVEDQQESYIIRTEVLDLRVNIDPWRVSFLRKDGSTITKEVLDDTDLKERYLGPPFGFTGTSSDNQDEDPTSTISRTNETLLLNSEEHIYGLGEKFTSFDKVGQKLTTWNHDALGVRTEKAYKNIPFFISSEGYGIFVNNTSKLEFHMGDLSNRTYSFSAPEKKLDYYFIYGPSLRRVLKSYTDLTGKPPIPPKWSFGLWLSTYFEEANRETVMEQVKNMKENEIPMDVYHFDCYWLRDNKWCDFEWDEEKFPNPSHMLDELNEKGIKSCVWENPYVSVLSDMYEEGVDKGYFLTHEDGSVYKAQTWTDIHPSTAIVDFTKPEAVEWYKEKHEKLIDMGVDTFKTDFGEEIPADAHFNNGKTGEIMRNVYPLLYNETVYNAMEENDKKGFVWARSAHAGSQRFPTHWSGDPHCTFEDMAAVLRSGLSFMMSGMSFWSHDIGGFVGKPSKKLYIRWAQLGLLSPHSRLHGWSNRDPWEFGEEALNIFKKYVKLRYRLIPHLFSYAKIASDKGLPLMRPMVLEYPNDPATFDLSGQFMLGRQLLIAPVLRKDDRKSIYLPEGIWKNYWSGEEFEGPASLNREVPLDELPMYVKEDSIIPLGPEMDYVGQKEEEITLYIFVKDETKFTYFDGEKEIDFKVRNTDSGLLFSASEAGQYNLLYKGEKGEVKVNENQEVSI